MPLISSPIPNLVNGVSQQAPALRLASQLEAQENAFSSVVEGLGPRPPSKHVKRLGSGSIANAAIHTINRDAAERYTVVIEESGVRVFDMDGVEKTVINEASTDYLTCSTAKTALKALTVSDHTFILNTEKTVAMSADLSTDPGEKGLIFVKQGQYSTDYNVKVDSYNLAVKTTSPSDPDDIKTTSIAADLAGQLSTNLNGVSVNAATWTQGGIAGESPDSITGWFAASSGNARIRVADTSYQIGDEVLFAGVTGSDASRFNGNTYAVVAIVSRTSVVTIFEVARTLPHGSGGTYVSGGTVTRTARQGQQTPAGTLTQTGIFTGYTPGLGDRIYITSGTGVTIGSYEIAPESIWGSGCHSANFIQLLTSPSTLGTSLGTGDIASASDWLIANRDSTISISRGNGAPFTIRASDSYGDRVLFAFKDQIQTFADLPIVAPRGYLVEITGDNSNEQDDYWVKFVPNNSAVSDFDKGVWVETVAPGIPYRLDATTMPHLLVRNGDGTFTFKVATWGERVAGDETTAENPSFVGTTISDVFFFRNRLGFLADENVILSVAGGFFDFFPQTVTTILDSDPVDVASTNTHVSNLKYAVPFREELLVFSDQSQFILSTGTNALLTPNSATLNETTAFEASLLTRPVGAGANVYFGFPRGDFSGVREYFVQANSDAKDAADITAHVPKYIPGLISKLTAASNEDVLIALSTSDPEGLYVYKYYWQGDQKLQSSWSRFSLEENSEVLSADFIESVLYLVVQRTDGFHLETMEFQPGQLDSGSAYVTLLDRRLTEAGVTIGFNAGTNITTWTLPYTITGTMRVVVRAGDADYAEGRSIPLLTQTGTTITALGDFRTSLVYIGQVCQASFEMSEPVIREDAKGGGLAAVQAGRLQVRNLMLAYNETAYFTTTVTPEGRDASVKSFNSQTLAGIANTGDVYLASGSFRVPVLSKSNQFSLVVSSDSHLPWHFTGAEWESHFTSRSQRG